MCVCASQSVCAVLIENSVLKSELTCLCLCVFLHPAWSVWWQHLPALCTGELPSAPPVGKRGVWHRVQFMTLLILSATTASEPQAVHAAHQRRAITLNTSWTVFLPSSITFRCFHTACGEAMRIYLSKSDFIELFGSHRI